MNGAAPGVRRLRIAVWVGAGLLALQTVRVVWSILGASTGSASPVAPTPALDVSAWHALPVQAGRTRPMATACSEIVREITGKSRFDKHDPVELVLAWMFEGDTGNRWGEYPLILCEHGELRREIYAHRESTPAGRHVSAQDLQSSPGFDRLLESVGNARRQHQEKAHLYLTTAQIKAEEVSRRLIKFDAVRGIRVTRLFGNAMTGEQYLDLRELDAIGPEARRQALNRAHDRQVRDTGPIRLAALEPSAGWLSPAFLKYLHEDPKRWSQWIQDRMMVAPQEYLTPADAAELVRFRDALIGGGGESVLGELRQIQSRRRARRIEEFQVADRAGRADEANRLFAEIARSPADRQRVQSVREKTLRAGANPAAIVAAVVGEMERILAEADDAVMTRLTAAVAHASAQRFEAQDPVVRALCLDYLEALNPELYRHSAAAREYPLEDATIIVNAFERVRAAFQTGRQQEFDVASAEFFAVLRAAAERVGQTYPGVDTIQLELVFHRTQPFRWAWAAMLLASGMLAVSLGLRSRIAFALGLALGAVSLGLQVFGFYARIRISGWAPVSNMYETIIFAALMSSVFAIALEAVYRKTWFVLTGSLVSTLALILADNLPLDSGIGGLVPVLRSNFWLTVHVVTIICGYAAGTLAWGIGNVTLGMLAFGRGDRDTLKLFSQFTYRALQLTVVLLAAGTFLGGWWASEAWGRFWGWDPKEVGALVALVCYVIPLHARYIGWVKDFGLAVSAVLCFASIIVSWYVINFVLAAGLHSYGFGGGGGPWVVWAVLLNLEWLLVAAWMYQRKAPA